MYQNNKLKVCITLKLKKNDKMLECNKKCESIEELLWMLEKGDTLIDEFEEELWHSALKM